MTDPRSSAVSPAARARLLLEAIRRSRMTRGRVGDARELAATMRTVDVGRDP
jgi:hypothetical protein